MITEKDLIWKQKLEKILEELDDATNHKQEDIFPVDTIPEIKRTDIVENEKGNLHTVNFLEHSEIASQTGPTLDEIVNYISEEDKKIKSEPKRLPNLTEDNWFEVLSELKIDLHQSYKEDPACIQIVEADENSRFGSLGNFSVVTGKAKSRKTFFVSMLIAAALIKALLQGKLLVTLPPNQPRIVLYDTEQSQFDVSKVGKRVLSMVRKQTDPLNFKRIETFDVISSRILSPRDRLILLEKHIYNTEDVGILVIDGVRDLINDINSQDEATMITSKLLKWSQERNIHIIVVLHQNKTDNNARGHLGTELNNKAETVISVEKDGEISVVRPVFSRGKDFTEFAFSIADGLPYILGEYSTKKDGKKETIIPSNYSPQLHKSVLQEIYLNNKHYRYNALAMAIKAAFESRGIKFGENKSKDFLTHYLDNEYIDKKDIEGVRYPVYILIQSAV